MYRCNTNTKRRTLDQNVELELNWMKSKREHVCVCVRARTASSKMKTEKQTKFMYVVKYNAQYPIVDTWRKHKSCAWKTSAQNDLVCFVCLSIKPQRINAQYLSEALMRSTQRMCTTNVHYIAIQYKTKGQDEKKSYERRKKKRRMHHWRGAQEQRA